MEAFNPVKTCGCESYIKVHTGKHLSDVYSVDSGLKQDDVLLLLLLSFALEYAI
jgi:hypothetical protein